jgi:hypothetical protein
MAETFAPARDRFAIHDWVVGILAGAGVGGFAGMFLTARVLDNPLMMIGTVLVGIVLGVLALRASHRNSDRLVNPVVVIAWLLGAVGWLMVIGVIQAIRNFT